MLNQEEEEKLEYDIGPDLWHAGIAEPFPNVHELFNYYNSIYFENKLGFCSVEWSSKRMTLCAGICMYRPGGGCCIRLSEPLLKFRPVKDLKETLLHEMIHAYMFLEGIRDREDHGPKFQAKMNAINDSRKPDYYRPPGGYRITVYHTMSDEVNLYRVHWWQCDRCQNIIKRAMNRPPQPADCRGRKGKGDECADPYCSYHMHLRHCGGNYVKIKGPELEPGAQQKAGNKKRKAVTGANATGASTSQASGANPDQKPSSTATGSQGNKDQTSPGQHRNKPGGTRPITDFFHKQGGEGSKGKATAGPSTVNKQPDISNQIKEEHTGDAPQKQGNSKPVAITHHQPAGDGDGKVFAVEVKGESMEERRRRCLQAAELRNKALKSEEPPDVETHRIGYPNEKSTALTTQQEAGNVPNSNGQRLDDVIAGLNAPNSAVVQDVVVIDQSPIQTCQRIDKESNSEDRQKKPAKQPVVPTLTSHRNAGVVVDRGQFIKGNTSAAGVGNVANHEVIVLDSDDEQQTNKQKDKQSTRVEEGFGILDHEQNLICPVCCFTLPKSAAQEMNYHLIQCLGDDVLM